MAILSYERSFKIIDTTTINNKDVKRILDAFKTEHQIVYKEIICKSIFLLLIHSTFDLLFIIFNIPLQSVTI